MLRRSYFIAASMFIMLGTSAACAASLPDGCGDDFVQYKVKTEKGKLLNAPPSGSSQLIVIHALAGDDWNGAPIARVAVDGKWIGAVKGRSYLAADIAPGSHTVCVSRQSGVRAEKENVSVGKINVQSGQAVYLAFTITRNELDEAKTHPGGQMFGYASPDMTAKRHETADAASLNEIKPESAPAYLRGLPESVFESK